MLENRINKIDDFSWIGGHTSIGGKSIIGKFRSITRIAEIGNGNHFISNASTHHYFYAHCHRHSKDPFIIFKDKATSYNW